MSTLHKNRPATLSPSLPTPSVKLPAKTRHVSEESKQGEGRESDVVVVAVFKLFSFMRLWLILVAKQPLKESRERGEQPTYKGKRERGGERGRHHQILCALEQLAELKMLLLTHKQTDTEQQRRGAQRRSQGGGALQAEEEVFPAYSWYSSYYKQSAAAAVKFCNSRLVL